jgi:AcrR family transcriptional regulator
MPATTRLRAPRKDAAENREALIMAAATLLNRDPSASLEAIATEAGLSRRAIYGHFSTRDELLQALALHGATRVNAALLGAAPEPEAQDPALQLAAVGARIWNEVDHIRVLALITLRGPQLSIVGDALRPLRDHVHDIVRRGIDEGVFRSDIEVDTLARLVESAAISVLDEASRFVVTSEEGRRLVVLSVLSIVGLGYRDADTILRALPDTVMSASSTSSTPEESR